MHLQVFDIYRHYAILIVYGSSSCIIPFKSSAYVIKLGSD